MVIIKSNQTPFPLEMDQSKELTRRKWVEGTGYIGRLSVIFTREITFVISCLLYSKPIPFIDFI